MSIRHFQQVFDIFDIFTPRKTKRSPQSNHDWEQTFSEIDFQGSNPERTWNLSFWGIQAAQRIQNIPFIDTPGAFVVHLFHSIVGPNRKDPREDDNKTVQGQRY